MEDLTELMIRLDITSETSRNAAHKTKKAQEEEPHLCVLCFYMFSSRNMLAKHCNKVHKANSKEICEEYKIACAEFVKSPDSNCARHNKNISLLKVTMLEKYLR